MSADVEGEAQDGPKAIEGLMELDREVQETLHALRQKLEQRTNQGLGAVWPDDRSRQQFWRIATGLLRTLKAEYQEDPDGKVSVTVNRCRRKPKPPVAPDI